MRLARTGVVAAGLAMTLAACSVHPIDPSSAVESGAAGALWGAAAGASLGAAVAINPALGAVIGSASGAAIGLATGIATARPAVTYAPIAPPATPIIPAFYDSWAPGIYSPPPGISAPPPPAGSG